MIHLTRRGLLGTTIAMAATTAFGTKLFAAVEPVVGFSIINLSDEFMVRLWNGAKAKGEALGVTVVLHNPDGDAKAQVAGIEGFITQNMKAVIVDAIDPNGIQPVLRQAKEAGLSVIATDEVLDKFPTVDAGVGLSNFQLGAEIANKVLAYQAETGMGQIVAACLQTLDAPIENTRLAGFASVVDKNADRIRIADRIDCKFSSNEAFKGAENVMVANPDLNLFFSNGASYTLGALAAIRSQGRKGAIKIAGIDFTKELFGSFKDGDYIVVAETDPEAMGARAVEVAVALAKGEKLSRDQSTPYYFRTKADLPELEKRFAN